MTFPDTIPAWMTSTPTCPAWCIDAAGHRNPTNIPGDWTRFQVAYREHLATTAGGRVTLEVAAHQSWEGNELADEPAQLTLLDCEDLTPVEATHLLGLLCAAQAVLVRITGGATGTI